MITALFQIRDPEMRAEYYERKREKRAAEAKAKEAPQEASAETPQTILCRALPLELELECLNIYNPSELNAERLQKIKEQLDAILKGKQGGGSGGGMLMPEPSMQKYDDGDSLNLDYPTDIPW